MYDFSKASDTKKYLSEILDEIKTAKIIGVFAHTMALFNKNSFSYMQDTPIYIMLDNGKCLVVDYMFIDELNIDYREMTEEEMAGYTDAAIKDCFNRSTDIHDSADMSKIICTETSTLAYGRLKSIKLDTIKDPYSAWVKGSIVELNPSEETFGTITFEMDNGNKFYICPGTAEDDGYSFLWSNDAIESEE